MFFRASGLPRSLCVQSFKNGVLKSPPPRLLKKALIPLKNSGYLAVKSVGLDRLNYPNISSSANPDLVSEWFRRHTNRAVAYGVLDAVGDHALKQLGHTLNTIAPHVPHLLPCIASCSLSVLLGSIVGAKSVRHSRRAFHFYQKLQEVTSKKA